MSQAKNIIHRPLRRTLVLFVLLSAFSVQLLAQCDTTKYGALINGSMSVPSKIAIAKSMGMPYVRMAITMSNWAGSSSSYERYRAANLGVQLNINWSSQNITGAPIPFQTNLVAYGTVLSQILTKYHDEELIAIENEETQKEYHSGPMIDYINQLDTAIQIVHARGLTVTNGGIHPQGVCYWVYQDYLNRSLPDSALWWKNETFSSGMLGGLSNPLSPINAYWRQIDTLLTAYETLDLDYVNLHIYESLNGVGDGIHVTANNIQIMDDYIFNRTGKHCITNETGQDNLDPTLVTNMLTAYQAAHYKYVFWWDGDGTQAKALNESNGLLRSNGAAFRDFVNNYYDTLCTGDTTIGGGDSSDVGTVVKQAYDIDADTTKLNGRSGGYNELQIHNSTFDTQGFLVNDGTGITSFKIGIDSIWSGADDTLFWRQTNGTTHYKVVTGGGGGGSQSWNDVMLINPDILQNISSDFGGFNWILNNIGEYTVFSGIGATGQSFLDIQNTFATLRTAKNDNGNAFFSVTLDNGEDPNTALMSAVGVDHQAFVQALGTGHLNLYSDVEIEAEGVDLTGTFSNKISLSAPAYIVPLPARTAITGIVTQNGDSLQTSTPQQLADSLRQYLETAAASFTWRVRDSVCSRPAYDLDDGDKFLVCPTGTGEFTGFDNQIAAYHSDGDTFSFEVASPGDYLQNSASGAVDKFDGAAWIYQNERRLLHNGGENDSLFSSYGTQQAFPAEIKTNNVRRWLFRPNGQTIINTAPTTYSTGNYDILVRNVTTKEINRIGSTSFIKPADTATMLAPYIRNISRSHDSVFAVYASGSVFKYKDSTGGGSSVTAGYGLSGTSTFVVDTNKIQTKLGWYDAVSWGADSSGVTDATSAIQAMINAAFASGKTAVTLYFRNGTYKISGSLLATDGTNTVNTAQLYIPYSAWSSASKVHIKILGESPPVQYTSRKQTVPVTKGVVFKSTITAGGGGAIFGTAYNTDGDNPLGFNFTETTFENVIITVRSKTGGGTDTIPTITAINADHIAIFHINNFVLNTESAMASTSQPATTARGLVCPALGNWARVTVNNGSIYNFYSGIVANDHLSAHDLYVATCFNGIEFTQSAGHVAYFDKVLLQWNVNSIKISGTSYFKIENMDIEDYTTAAGDPSKWYNNSLDIYEPSVSNSLASISYQRSRSAFGVDNAGFSVTTTLSPTVKYNRIDEPIILVGANKAPNNQSLYVIGTNDGALATTPTYAVRDVAVFENNNDAYIGIAAKSTNTAGLKFYKTAGASETAILSYNFSTNAFNWTSNLTSTTFAIGNGNGTLWNIATGGNLSNTGSTGTAYLHLKAGTATASTAPIKLTSGTVNTTPETGAIEYTDPVPYFTNSGGLRQQFFIGIPRRLASQFNATSTTTLADVVGIGVNVAAGKIYRFEAVLYTTSNVAGGVKVNIGGSATATSIIYEAEVWQGGIPVATGAQRGTSFAAAVGDVTAVTTAKIIINGIITVNAAGYIIPQFAQNASNGTASSVLVGSTFTVNEMP